MNAGCESVYPSKLSVAGERGTVSGVQEIQRSTRDPVCDFLFWRSKETRSGGRIKGVFLGVKNAWALCRLFFDPNCGDFLCFVYFSNVEGQSVPSCICNTSLTLFPHLQFGKFCVSGRNLSAGNLKASGRWHMAGAIRRPSFLRYDEGRFQ